MIELKKKKKEGQGSQNKDPQRQAVAEGPPGGAEQSQQIELHVSCKQVNSAVHPKGTFAADQVTQSERSRTSGATECLLVPEYQGGSA